MAGSKTAGKKGTRAASKRPRGARGTGGGSMFAQIASFFSGVLVSLGTGNAIKGGADMLSDGEPLHPAIDGTLATVSGAGVTGLGAAASKPLRKFAWSHLAGNVAGGAGRGLVRYFREKPPAAGRSVREELRRKQLAAAGRSVREEMAPNRTMTARQLMSN